MRANVPVNFLFEGSLTIWLMAMTVQRKVHSCLLLLKKVTLKKNQKNN